jgi:lipopolysaccharide export LptBFGC system permease protein LptF
LLLLALLGSATLFGLEERVLAFSNRKADAINDTIRGRLAKTYSLNRQWIAATTGNIYQYVYFDSARKKLIGLAVYEFGKDLSTLSRRSYFSEASFNGDRETKGLVTWQGSAGWVREFSPVLRYAPFGSQQVVLDGPGYFGSQRPDAEAMSYSELRDHIAGLRSSGFNVVPYLVELHRKLAFPFITLIMALIAVPFAVTTGKRGAMYGIGAGIVLAILYWTAISVFAGIGAAGLMSPMLAAWAPNLVFGCVALYLLLTVRT